jgi:chlorobactene glucosyltransferase
MVTPWIVLGAFMAFGIRFPRPLPPPPAPDGAGRPRVSIVVPARNEEHNIGRCLSSLTAQEYPDFEVLVVDDRSEDRTAAIVRKHPTGNAHRVVLVEGRPLPPGWFGKPWACQQGAEAATGDLLLFTDADTIHAPLLLARSVAALQEDRADALSLVGRQIMETFWERVVQPQIFTLIGMRYTRLDRPVDGGRWTAAVANGQYMLLTRPALEGMGGHAAVKHEVVEDIRMAQELVRGGGRITIRGAEDALGTRMYRNLRELVDGWTKNLFTGARQAAPRGLGAVAVPAILLHLVVLWLLPPPRAPGRPRRLARGGDASLVRRDDAALRPALGGGIAEDAGASRLWAGLPPRGRGRRPHRGAELDPGEPPHRVEGKALRGGGGLTLPPRVPVTRHGSRGCTATGVPGSIPPSACSNRAARTARVTGSTPGRSSRPSTRARLTAAFPPSPSSTAFR